MSNNNKPKNNMIVDYNGPQAQSNREALQTEINRDKVKIDKSIFKKTDYEKAELKKAKLRFKEAQNRLVC